MCFFHTSIRQSAITYIWHEAPSPWPPMTTIQLFKQTDQHIPHQKEWSIGEVNMIPVTTHFIQLPTPHTTTYAPQIPTPHELVICCHLYCSWSVLFALCSFSFSWHSCSKKPSFGPISLLARTKPVAACTVIPFLIIKYAITRVDDLL